MNYGGSQECKTIANFRKDNPKAFKNLFNSFTKFCLELEQYGKATVAIDGSKFRAQNLKKNNYNLRKINKHLDYIANQEETITILADKGYYSGKQIAKCHDQKMDTFVSPKSKGSKSKDPRKLVFTPTEDFVNMLNQLKQ